MSDDEDFLDVNDEPSRGTREEPARSPRRLRPGDGRLLMGLAAGGADGIAARCQGLVHYGPRTDTGSTAAHGGLGDLHPLGDPHKG